MSWLTNFVRPKLRALVARKETPENLWLKCPKCEQMLFMRDWEANQEVCTHCGHHMRASAAERLTWTFDANSFTRIELPKVVPDPLRFRDSKRYRDRLAQAQKATGEKDALVVLAGRLFELQVVACAFEFRFLGGSMGSRLFEEIREKRGLCYSVYAADHAFADVPVLQLGSGRDSAKCIEAYTRMREIVDELRDDGPTEEEVARARAYAAGRLVLAFENTGAVARYAASRTIVFGEDTDPDAAITALDNVTFDEVRSVAAGVADNLAVACVGPHEAGEF